MCCHTHEIMDVAAAVEQDTSLREQNKALLVSLAEIEEMGRHWPSVESVMKIAQDAIAQAKARGGSRADGPLLREETDAKS